MFAVVAMVDFDAVDGVSRTSAPGATIRAAVAIAPVELAGWLSFVHCGSLLPKCGSSAVSAEGDGVALFIAHVGEDATE